jgi:hypothetical protein
MYFPCSTPTAVTAQLGGTNEAGWRCPACDRMLLRILTIDGDSELAPPGWTQPTVNLLYCWSCNLKLGGFWYGIVDNALEVVEFLPGDTDGEVYDGYPAEFPASTIHYAKLAPSLDAYLLEVSSIVTDSLQKFPLEGRLRSKLDLVHYIGPVDLAERLVQAEYCPRCSSAASLYCSIPTVMGEVKFTDDPWVTMHFFVCAPCELILAAHTC